MVKPGKRGGSKFMTKKPPSQGKPFEGEGTQNSLNTLNGRQNEKLLPALIPIKGGKMPDRDH